MLSKVTRWLFPKKDDPLNLVLWRLAPWIAAIEWAWILTAAMLSPTCIGIDYGRYEFWVTIFTPLVLFLISLRALACGACPRTGSIILAATNGFLLAVSFLRA